MTQLASRPTNKVDVHNVLRNEQDSLVASEEIFFGALIEKFDDTGVVKWRNKSSATAITSRYVALQFIERNVPTSSVDDITESYAIGETVMSGIWQVGSILTLRLASGQDISLAEFLEADATGKVVTSAIVTAAAGLAIFQSRISTGGATAAITRIEVDVIA